MRADRLSLHYQILRSLGFSQKESTGAYRNRTAESFQRSTGIDARQYNALKEMREQGVRISTDKTATVRAWIETRTESEIARLGGPAKDKVLERFDYIVTAIRDKGALTDTEIDRIEQDVKTNGLSVKKGRRQRGRNYTYDIWGGPGEIGPNFWDTP